MDNNFYVNLINTVKAEKIIYEKSHPYYMDRDERNKAWIRISTKLGKSREACERRWRLLREKFARIRLETCDSQQGSSGEDGNHWPYLKHMYFLKNHIKRRSRRKHLEAALEETVMVNMKCENTCDDYDMTYDYKPVKRLKCETTESYDHDHDQEQEEKYDDDAGLNQEMVKEEDMDEDVVDQLKNAITLFTSKITDDMEEDDLYVRNIVAMMKVFSPIKKDELKSKIFSMIMSERRALYNNQ